MKCAKCDKDLPESEFYVRKDNGKHRGVCKICCTLKNLAYYKENKKSHNEIVKKRYDDFGRFNRYGLTKEKYLKALSDQGGCCKLCGVPDPGGKGKWHIDHLHDGKYKRNVFKQGNEEHFRGLLCHNCNISLGHYEKLVEKIGVDKIQAYIGVK